MRISKKAEDLLPKLLEEIEKEGLMNWEVEWLANNIIRAQKRSCNTALFAVPIIPDEPWESF